MAKPGVEVVDLSPNKMVAQRKTLNVLNNKDGRQQAQATIET